MAKYSLEPILYSSARYIIENEFDFQKTTHEWKPFNIDFDSRHLLVNVDKSTINT